MLSVENGRVEKLNSMSYKVALVPVIQNNPGKALREKASNLDWRLSGY